MDRIRSAAVILLSIGEKCASEVLKVLSPTEVKSIIEEINKVNSISDEELNEAFDTFFSETMQKSMIDQETKNHVKSTLMEALNTNSIILDTEDGQRAKWLDLIKYEPMTNVVELISVEHPQVIAVILSIVNDHVDKHLSTEILKLFDKEKRSMVIDRMSHLGSISTISIKNLNRVYDKKFIEFQKNNTVKINGIESAAEIISYLDVEMEKEIYKDISGHDEQVVEQIQDALFPFEKLVDLEGKNMQVLLKEVENDDLVYALKGADQFIKEFFFKNMSSKSAEILQEEIASMGPIKLAKVLEAQKKIVMKAKELAEAEKIILKIKKDTALVE